MANWFFNFLPFEFASPIFLLGAAITICLFVFLSVRKKSAAYMYSDLRLLGRKNGILLRGLIWALLIILTLSLFGALSRPETVEQVILPVESRDFVCVTDFSSSMQMPFAGTDNKISKFNTGRDSLFSFIEKRNSDRFGCVLFAIESYSMPLLPGTSHILENRALLEGLEINTPSRLAKIPANDTRLGTAIRSALSIFERMSTAYTKVLIIMSDLVTNSQDVDTVVALREAREAGISRVYILAVDAYPEEIKRLSSKQEDFIRAFDVRDEVALKEAYYEIERLEASEVGERVIDRKESIEDYFLISALASFVLLAFLSFTIWRRIL